MENNNEVKKPRKVVEKPLNPLAQKPGQKYNSTKYVPSKEYNGGEITYEETDKK